jgi:hypothetical protein
VLLAQSLRQNRYNLTHSINRLSFGIDYPGIVNPLDNNTKLIESTEGSLYWKPACAPSCMPHNLVPAGLQGQQ